MAFGDNARPKTDAAGGANTGKTESAFMKLGDEAVIRILDKTENVFVYWRYYMPVNVGGKQADRSITVGRNGPIKEFMDSIGTGDRRFKKPSKRILSNVLDRADNTVKILDYGSDLLNKFTALHGRIRKRGSMDALNIWDFDINIISTQGAEPKDVSRTVYPAEDQDPLGLDLQALPLYDLTLVQRPLPDEMQQRILNGDDYIEIMREIGWGRPVPTVPQV